MEIWKPIEGFEDRYEISNKGRVKSINRIIKVFNKGGIKRVPDKILRISKDHKGYAVVGIGRKTCKVHRLVAKAFIDNPDNKPQINHIDGNKMNNTAENLEWSTQAENTIHRYYSLKKGITPVLCIETKKIYPSMAEAQRKTGICSGEISRAISGKRNIKTAGGLHWTLANDTVQRRNN